jgi:hypothetical protein
VNKAVVPALGAPMSKKSGQRFAAGDFMLSAPENAVRFFRHCLPCKTRWGGLSKVIVTTETLVTGRSGMIISHNADFPAIS